MMKKALTLIISLAIILSFSMPALAASFTLDTTNTTNGILKVTNIEDTGKRVRIRITKDDQKYLYEVRAEQTVESYPLQMGSGKYKIDILKNIIDNRYTVLSSTTIDVKIENSLNVFLNPIQPIFWNDSMKAVKYADWIMDSDKSADQKIKTVYNHMVYYYKYDWDKYGNLPSTYVPNVEETYLEKKGVCYDYAALTASLLRSMGYPARLVKGYSTLVDGYHAWNEIYIDGKWVVVDTTYDSMSNKTKISFAKKSSDYQAVGIY